MRKALVFALAVLLVAFGGCIGAWGMYRYYNPPAYPGPGDWNGDGELTVADISAAIHQIIHGPEYPEYATGG